MDNDVTTRGSGDTNFDIDQQGVLEPITVPFFEQISVGGPYATTLSWIGFIGTLATIALAIFWVYLIVRASFMQLKSAEKPEEKTESAKKIQSMLVGATIAMIFPVVITVIGIIIGVGPIWKWPEGFRECVGSADNEFYFQAALRNKTIDQAEVDCFGGGASNITD